MSCAVGLVVAIVRGRNSTIKVVDINIILYVNRPQNEQLPPGVEPAAHHSHHVRVPPVRTVVGARLHGQPAALQPQENHHLLQRRPDFLVDISSYAGKRFLIVSCSVSSFLNLAPKPCN